MKLNGYGCSGRWVTWVTMAWKRQKDEDCQVSGKSLIIQGKRG